MSNKKQQGVVSLFVVIFSTLLLTVLVVGFLRLMIQEQKQAINQDLSQSAYDSAVSGVEDAKRVLSACTQGNAAACTAIDPPAGKKCDTVSAAGIVSHVTDSSETIVNGDGTGATTNLNQGYTCVLVYSQSDDYIGNLIEGDSQIVPLRAIGAIAKIDIEWMHKDNGAGGSGFAGGDPVDIVQPTAAAGIALPAKADWSSNAPALLRVQAVLPGAATVDVANLDTNVATTTYLRPSVINDVSNLPILLPGLRATSGANPVKTEPLAVNCSNTVYGNGGYACKVTLMVPASIGTVPSGSKVAFLRLSALYRNTSYKITLKDSSDTVLKFDGVQPTVDSTGRAGNVFRRVSSRLDMTSFIVPPAAVDITGSLCKNFYITDNVTPASGMSPTCDTNPTP